jgi:hypothetical protein
LLPGCVYGRSPTGNYDIRCPGFETACHLPQPLRKPVVVHRNDEVSLLDKTGVGQPAAEGYNEWMGRFANPGDARWSPLLSPRDSRRAYRAGCGKQAAHDGPPRCAVHGMIPD